MPHSRNGHAWHSLRKLCKTSGWFQILQHTAKAFRGFPTFPFSFKSDMNLR